MDKISKPADLIRFISDIPVLEDGTVPLNLINYEPYQSELYEPNFRLSSVSLNTQRLIERDIITSNNEELDENTIVFKAINSDLAEQAPEIYLLLRTIVMESFSFIYHIEEDRRPLEYISPRDILMVKENINYVADYLGTEEKYHHMIEVLRLMHTSLGYLQHQIDLIVSEAGVRYG